MSLLTSPNSTNPIDCQLNKLMKCLPEEMFRKLLATRTYKYARLNQMVHPSFYLKSLIKASNEQIKNTEKPSKKRGRRPKKKEAKLVKSEGSSEELYPKQLKTSRLFSKNLTYFKSVIVQCRVAKTDQAVPNPPPTQFHS